MPVLPLSLALPTAGAALAYLNARYHVFQDLNLIKTILVGSAKAEKTFKSGTGSLFYTLESHALSPQTANRTFIAVPPELPEKEQLSLESVRSLQCQEWSYRQTYDIVLQYAAWLKEDVGVKKGDVVALDYLNKPEFIFIWYGIWSLGARPAFLNTALRGDGLIHCIRASVSKVAVFDAELQEALTDDVRRKLADMNVDTRVMDAATSASVLGRKGYRAGDECRADIGILDMAQLIFTSGTTGLPKAAVVNWRRSAVAPVGVANYLNVTPADRYYTALPLYHSSGSLMAVNVALASGACVVVAPRFSPRTFFASLVASRATMFQYIGEMCRYLMSVPPSPFDTAHAVTRCFGNGMRPDVWKPFKERYAIDEICEFYGATESPASTLVKSRNNFGEGAIGRGGPLIKMLRGVQTAIIKHDVETGEPVRDAATGLCQKVNDGEAGEYIALVDIKDVKEHFAGYLGDEKASSKKILRDVLKKGDAYFRTGDLLKADREGRIYFVDRIGDTYRWKGENVSTGEVEKAVASHPSVEEANVYGVQLPGHDGRAGCAAVLFKEEPTPQSLQSLSKHVLKALPRFAAPLFIRTVKTMETTGTSKYTKHGLRVQGVEHSKVGGDRLFWLDPKTGVYVDFTPTHWQGITAGRVRL